MNDYDAHCGCDELDDRTWRELCAEELREREARAVEVDEVQDEDVEDVAVPCPF